MTKNERVSIAKVVSASSKIDYNAVRVTLQDGDAIVVGAPSLSRRNLAYVYRFDGVSSWSEEAKVLSDETFNEGFGSSVAIAGEVIAVGAPGRSEGSAGSAYVFRFDSSTSQWPQDLKVLSDLSPGGTMECAASRKHTLQKSTHYYGDAAED